MMRPQPRTLLGKHSSWISLSCRSLPQYTIRGTSGARSQSSESDSPFTSSDPSTEHAPRRRRRFKKASQSKRITLDVDSLGQPGEIVVVPPKPPRTLKSKLREAQNITTEDAQPLTLSSMLEDLEEEYTPLTSTEIQGRIEKERETANCTGKLSAHEWETTRSRLASSFTYNQLSEYVEDHQVNGKQGFRDPDAWRPGTSAFTQTYSGHATGPSRRVASSHDLKGKALLAERILRDCWDFSIVEEIGQIDLRLSPSHVSLLLTAEHFSFDEIATLHESSIDVTSSLGLVRITGRQDSCESMSEIIRDAIARIREDSVAIDPAAFRAVMNHSVSQRLFDFISETYGISFDTDDSQAPKKILYLAENREGAENARRALNLALREVTPSSIPFSTYFSASDTANTYNHNPEDSVSWLDQQRQWFRWAMPSTQSTESSSDATDLFNNHQTRLSDHLLNLLRKTSAPKVTSGGTLNVHESITASVGHCLFGRKQSAENASMNPAQLGKLSLPRTFSTDIPRVINYLTSLRPITPVVGNQLHTLRLTPSFEHAHTAPTLEVTILSKLGMKLDTTEDAFEVQKVRVILASNEVDYLLPENGLDLRFHRTLYHEITSESVTDNSDLQELVNGIKSCLRGTFGTTSLNLSPSDDSVPLPAFCHLTLPRRILAKSEQSLSLGEESPPLQAEYIFPPIHNIRRAAVQLYELAHRQLSYNHQETGPVLPGRVVNVSLGMELANTPRGTDITEAQDHVALEKDFHSFYNTACRMAFDIHGLKLSGTDDGIFEPSPMFR
ncbi:Uncharacterized protein PECH_000241 [Penicillium ucsense]|uniref:Respiratory complex assembly protein Rmp1 n=1 Tax=Penicillium ucsense TaxID=2839758 RepID=A0A8J8W6E5_9EURO|nr:Uncharacterized protein PECM_008568 [Penicillium ucsense]KAF7738522.1 Uncharacterized protein PECH_000241 [Penicillium ucsense]